MTTWRENIRKTLWADFNEKENYPNITPLLAHYTSIENVELILKSEEFWFSNPLNMNDVEEMRFVILQSWEKLLNNTKIKQSCPTTQFYDQFINAYYQLFDKFSNDHCLDIYAFCFTKHDRKNSDGLLSMWRGYGGNGKGAALVIDSSKLTPSDNSPFSISKITYLTGAVRMAWLDRVMERMSDLINLHQTEHGFIDEATKILFERVKRFAIFTKHNGFKEENEWRVVYFREQNQNIELDKMLGYAITSRGIEPKLKLNLTKYKSPVDAELSISKLINKIILGPNASSPMSKTTFLRMLDIINRPELKELVETSTIPFRPV